MKCESIKMIVRLSSLVPKKKHTLVLRKGKEKSYLDYTEKEKPFHRNLAHPLKNAFHNAYATWHCMWPDLC